MNTNQMLNEILKWAGKKKYIVSDDSYYSPNGRGKLKLYYRMWVYKKLKSCKHCKNPEFKNIISFDFGSGSREDGIKDVYNKMQEIIKEEDNQ